MKFLEDNIGETFHDFGLGKIFSGMSSKAQASKLKIDNGISSTQYQPPKNPEPKRQTQNTDIKMSKRTE